MTQLSLIPGSGGADFSECGLYRYDLRRVRDKNGPLFVYIGLNPSKADAETNDATTVRNLTRAWNLGAGRYIAVNLFSIVATDPKDMKAEDSPIGPRNDETIMQAATEATWILCGWGFHGAHRDRARYVLRMLRTAGFKLYCLGLTNDGEPRHPLYIAKARALEAMPA